VGTTSVISDGPAAAVPGSAVGRRVAGPWLIDIAAAVLVFLFGLLTNLFTVLNNA
jgi:hypothetical protein